MSYPNIYRQSDTLINSIVKCFVIKFDKLKEILSKGVYTKQTTNALRHQATNYNDITSYEKLQQYVKELPDYSGYATEVVHMIIKNLITERINIALLPYVCEHKLEMQETFDSEVELLHYKSFEDSTVEAELTLMKTQIGSLDELIKQLQTEQLSSKTKIEELESKLDQYIGLTNEFLVVRAEDASKIQSLEESHVETQTAQALQAYSIHKLEEDNIKLNADKTKLSAEVSELWKFANFSKEQIGEQHGQIGKQQVQISEQNVQIGEQKVHIGEQQVQIGKLINTVGVQQVQIEVLTTDVKEKTVRIEALEYKVGEQLIVICEQQQELTEVKVELAEVKVELTEVKRTILENQAKAAAMYENLLSFKEDLVSMEEGIVTKELIDSLISKAHVLVGVSYSVITNLNYHKAPSDERSQWKKMVDTLRSYLKRMSKFNLNPSAQLQMIDKIEKDHYIDYVNAT